MRLRGTRELVGSVPVGDSISVGQFRGANVFECLPPVLGTFSVLPYANLLREGSRPFVRAKFLIVDQLGDGGVVAADRALRIAPRLELAEAHGQSVV